MVAAGYLCAMLGLGAFVFFVLVLGVSPALTGWAREREAMNPGAMSIAARAGLCVYAFVARYWWAVLPASVLSCVVGALLLLISSQNPR
ncbi:MAG: hypothetical protein ACE5O2_07570 [Armatimonadota bacterium]